MKLDQHIKKNKQQIDQELQVFFEQTKHAYDKGAIAVELIEAIEKVAMAGGKRLRPLLMGLCYQMYGGKNIGLQYKAGVTLELLHTFMLIHDDIEDGDLMRHGVQTIEAAYLSTLPIRNIRKREHVATALAINAGDIAHSLVYNSLADLHIPAEVCVKLMQLVSVKSVWTALGQQYDILAPTQKDITIENIRKIGLYKTAYYSFELPLLFGAILSNQTNELEALRKVGQTLGLGFQIMDDILGVYGNSDKLGKPNTSDMREGKKTLLLAYAVQKASKKQQLVIDSIWGNPASDLKQLKQIQSIFETTGALNQTKLLCQQLYEECIVQIKALSIAPTSQQMLFEFASKCMKRDH